MNNKTPLKLNRFSAVIFDLDGTLVDSVPDLALAINNALSQLSLGSVSQEQVRMWVGNGSRKLVERTLDALAINDIETLQQLHETFLVSYKQFLCADSVLYPGVEALLKQLSANNIALGLVTNKPIEFVPHLLESLGIHHYFQTLIGGDSLPEKKPSPMPLRHVAQTLNVTEDKCLMIGDSESDVRSAQAANMPCVLLRQGYNQGQDLSAMNPNWLLHDVLELAAHL